MVVAAFLASFVVFGLIYSFGVFLKPMAAEFGRQRRRRLRVFLDHRGRLLFIGSG